MDDLEHSKHEFGRAKTIQALIRFTAFGSLKYRLPLQLCCLTIKLGTARIIEPPTTMESRVSTSSASQSQLLPLQEAFGVMVGRPFQRFVFVHCIFTVCQSPPLKRGFRDTRPKCRSWREKIKEMPRHLKAEID